MCVEPRANLLSICHFLHVGEVTGLEQLEEATYFLLDLKGEKLISMLVDEAQTYENRP